jgi:hypothetical protein
VLAGAVTVGFTLLAGGWWGATGTRVFDDQVAFARLAAIGVLAAQGGFVWSLVRGRRALGHRVRNVGHLSALGSAVPPAASGATAVPPPGLVAAPDMTRYHRPDCAFTAGKAVSAASAADHAAAGRRPCGVCRP